VEDLTALGHLDQYHYLGVEACDHVATILGLGPERHVLDIGSGIGGPARYFAHKTKCTVTGVELQEGLVEAGKILTERVGLAASVDFIAADFTDVAFPTQYEHFISLLVFLHIPARAKVFNKCSELLKPGGTFVIEDFYELRPFTDEETAMLRDGVAAVSVVSQQKYRSELEAAGFTDIEFVDLTPIWQQWTKARHEGFLRTKDKSVALHGMEHFESRAKFYSIIDKLFAGGNLGGVRISGAKPGGDGMLLDALKTGRQSLGSHSGTKAVLNETGMAVDDVV
jgi:cyclopropane fatty-acyl-phospholipid synthase-like methyltransferase